VYRFLTQHVPPDRPRSATYRSGFSRLVADGTAEYLVSAGWRPEAALAGADLFIGGLEAAASRWVEEPSGSYEELADQLTAVLWAGFRRAGETSAPPG
jgi:hypothetical protein